MDRHWPPAKRAYKAVRAYLKQDETPAQERLQVVISRIPQKMTLAQKKPRYTEASAADMYQRRFDDFSQGPLSGVTFAQIAEEYRLVANRALRVMKRLPGSAVFVNAKADDDDDASWYLGHLGGGRSAPVTRGCVVYGPGAFAEITVPADQRYAPDVASVLPGSAPRACMTCYPDDGTLAASLRYSTAEVTLDFSASLGKKDNHTKLNAAYLGLAFAFFKGPFHLLFWTRNGVTMALPIDVAPSGYSGALLRQGETPFMMIMPLRD